MRVGTLIEILETMPSEAEVRLHHPMGEEVLFAANIETGRRNIKASDLKIMKKLLDVPYENFF